jgi:hypothetical protein
MGEASVGFVHHIPKILMSNATPYVAGEALETTPVMF